MAGRAFRTRIRAIRDGEPVNAAVAGRPDADLQANLNYLLDLITDLAGGQGAVRRRATLDPTLLAGQAVYYDANAQRFAPALAAVIQDDPVAGLVLAPSTDCVGVVLFKENNTLGDVLLAGYGAVDLAPAIQEGGPALPGRYYLSTSQPGMLVRQRPALSVAVLVADGLGGVYVQPTLRNFVEDHVHYEFRLAARPAGGNGGAAVTDPDPTLPGWLPADHPSFAGQGPAGAAFGYNLAADPALSRIWPPVPLSSAHVFWDKGQGHVGATAVPMGPAGLVAVDRDGIWWMSADAGDVPWPAGWAPPGDPVPPNDADGPESPRLEEMQVTLTFTRMLFSTNKTVVTSLQPAADAPLSLTDCDGRPATTGDLYVGIDLTFIDSPDLVRGGIAFKELDGAILRKGWVVEGFRQGANCKLTGSHQEAVGTGDAAYTLHQGEVLLDVLTSTGERELAPQVERLWDAQQRYYMDIPYIGFAPDRQSGLRYVFDVPPDGLPTAPLLAVRLRLLARAAGNLPALTLTYRRLPRPAPGAAVTLPGVAAELPLAFPTAGVAVPTDGYLDIESDPLAVAPGDTVLVQLSRGGGDGYPGELGVLRSGGIVTGGAT